MKNKVPNLWLMRFNDEYGFNILKNIIQEKVNISLITGNAKTSNLLNKHLVENKQNFEFLDNNEICILKFKFENRASSTKKISHFFNSKYYKAYYIALQIMERNERFSGELSFEERNYAIYKQVEFWEKKIEDQKPTNIIFFDIPHTYYEQIIIAICEEKKIPCMSIRETSFAKTTFLNSKFKLISGYGGKKLNKVNKEYFHMVKNNKQKEIDIELNADQVTITFIIKTFLKVIYTFLFTKHKKYTLGYFIKCNYFEFGENSFLNERIQQLFYAWNCLRLRLLYKRLSNKPNFDSNFVYMPLISGYECALHPVASPLNIFMILDYLLKILPKNCNIYIKEHPSQFRFRYHQRFSRSKNFYYKISKMRRVKFININEDHYKLISKSKFVVGSSTSSAAVQSVSLKKKYKYYGFHYVSNKYIEPLFKQNNNNISRDNNFFHEEWSYNNSSLDSVSIAKKIILWVNDNL